MSNTLEEVNLGLVVPPVEPWIVEDMAALANLLPHDTNRQISTDEVARNINEIVFNPLQFLTVAVNSGRIVGMATLTIKTIPTERTGYIDDVVIHPDYRRRGISTELMGFIEVLAADQEIQKLQLTSADHRQEALGLYRSLGFVLKDTNFLTKEI